METTVIEDILGGRSVSLMTEAGDPIKVGTLEQLLKRMEPELKVTFNRIPNGDLMRATITIKRAGHLPRMEEGIADAFRRADLKYERLQPQPA